MKSFLISQFNFKRFQYSPKVDEKIDNKNFEEFSNKLSNLENLKTLTLFIPRSKFMKQF